MSIAIEIWTEITPSTVFPQLGGNWQPGYITNDKGTTYYVYTRLPVKEVGDE